MIINNYFSFNWHSPSRNHNSYQINKGVDPGVGGGGGGGGDWLASCLPWSTRKNENKYIKNMTMALGKV